MHGRPLPPTPSCSEHTAEPREAQVASRDLMWVDGRPTRWPTGAALEVGVWEHEARADSSRGFPARASVSPPGQGHRPVVTSRVDTCLLHGERS